MARIWTPPRATDPALIAVCDALMPTVREVATQAKALEISLTTLRAATVALGGEGEALRGALSTYLENVRAINRRHPPDEMTMVETMIAEVRRPRGPTHKLRWALTKVEQPAELMHCTTTHAFYRLGWGALQGFSLDTGRGEGARPEHGMDELVMPRAVREEVKQAMAPWLTEQQAARLKRQGRRGVSSRPAR